MNRGLPAFPIYTRAEAASDGVIHLLGFPAALGAAIWLLGEAGETGRGGLIATLIVYSLGLLGMLGASAAYNLCPPCRIKEHLRRLDHAMIFVMIAGTYTPFALEGLPRLQGIALAATAWSVAAAGILLKLRWPRRFERASLALYLCMGWMVLPMLGSFLHRLRADALWLLLGGGLVYSVGSVVHSCRGLKFHNTVWHALVLLGAGLHLAAIKLQFVHLS